LSKLQETHLLYISCLQAGHTYKNDNVWLVKKWDAITLQRYKTYNCISCQTIKRV